MRDYKRLKVWEKAHGLALAVYQVSRSFPKQEMYGLTSQVRRCAVSIPANIAEGYGRSGDAELLRYLHIAQGSSSELSYHLLLTKDLEYISGEQFQYLEHDLSEVQKMLAAFINSIREGAESA